MVTNDFLDYFIEYKSNIYLKEKQLAPPESQLQKVILL